MLSFNKELYHQKLAHFASLIFITSQSIILANHDVRTDAVLTGVTIFYLAAIPIHKDQENSSNHFGCHWYGTRFLYQRNVWSIYYMYHLTISPTLHEKPESDSKL